jgi:hypothetical protein
LQFQIVFLPCLVLIITGSANNTFEQHKFVFKADGTKHCNPNPGIELTTMQQELSSKKIDVYSMHKGHDGREGIALCGQSTGQINIYEIKSSDLSTAIGLGFKEIHEN